MLVLFLSIIAVVAVFAMHNSNTKQTHAFSASNLSYMVFCDVQNREILPESIGSYELAYSVDRDSRIYLYSSAFVVGRLDVLMSGTELHTIQPVSGWFSSRWVRWGLDRNTGTFPPLNFTGGVGMYWWCIFRSVFTNFEFPPQFLPAGTYQISFRVRCDSTHAQHEISLDHAIFLPENLYLYNIDNLLGQANPPFGYEAGSAYVNSWPYRGAPVWFDAQVSHSYRRKTFGIEFSVNGGTFATATFFARYDMIEIWVFPVPTRNGYTFKGWHNNPHFLGDTTSYLPSGSYGNRRYYARWQATQWTLTVNLNGGVSPVVIPHSFSMHTARIILPNPVRGGFTFLGWYTNANFTTRIASIETGTNHHVSIYARWQAIEFLIQWFVNGGELPANTPIVYTAENDMLVLPAPTKQGYEFKGWYTTLNFVGARATNIPSGSVGNRSFFARWERKTFLLTIFVDGVIFREFSVAYGTVLSDYTFINANTQRSVDFFADPMLSAEWDVHSGISSNVTLFAHATFSISVQISYDVNGVITTEMRQYNSALDNLKVPLVYGFEFLGWYYDEHFTRPVNAIDRIHSNTTLFARVVEVEEIIESGANWLVWVLAITGMVIVGVIVGAVIVKKKKKG